MEMKNKEKNSLKKKLASYANASDQLKSLVNENAALKEQITYQSSELESFNTTQAEYEKEN